MKCFKDGWEGGSLHHDHYVIGETTAIRFGAMKSSVIRSIIIIFHKFGPETDPLGHPLVMRLELEEFPVTWAVRSLKKSITML